MELSAAPSRLEGGSRAPSHRVSPGSGRAPPVRVSRPRRSLLCQAARGGRGVHAPPLQGLFWLGQSTLCWCCCPFTVCSADQWREYCDACSQALSWGVVCLIAAQHLDLICLTVLGSNQHKAHQCQSNSLNCRNSKAILLRESQRSCPCRDSSCSRRVGEPALQCSAGGFPRRWPFWERPSDSSTAPRGQCGRWLDNKVVTTDQTPRAWSATEVALRTAALVSP